MKLMFKQRMFSWFDSYDVYDENGKTLFTVEGQLSWGKCLHVLDSVGNHVATLKQELFTFLPAFEIYVGEELRGPVTKEFSFFRPSFSIDFRGWTADGDFWEWDYDIRDEKGEHVASIAKELFQWTDTYTIDVPDPSDALDALMLVLAIDAEKDARN
ncbi:MAG: LURP-one-related family protein [Clostridia bacterium]|nr:LURP-one-related family protein [Clostridia bacterium]